MSFGPPHGTLAAVSDSTNILDDFERRMIALIDDRPFRFRRTRRRDAEAWLQKQRTFRGFVKAELDAIEASLGIRLPAFYRAFAERFGAEGGPLTCGTRFVPPGELVEERAWAVELIEAAINCGLSPPGTPTELPDDAIVFESHQGYMFFFFRAGDDDDPPVWGRVEGDAAPGVAAASLSTHYAQRLEQAEELERNRQQKGGYWVEVHPDGTTSTTYSSHALGRRPTDVGDNFWNVGQAIAGGLWNRIRRWRDRRQFQRMLAEHRMKLPPR